MHTKKDRMRPHNDYGFTLIELLIVVAIIAILAAIAIPQFAAYRERALEASMISDARNTSIAMDALAADCQVYAALAQTAIGPTSAIVGAGAIGMCSATNPGIRINVSRANQITVTLPAPGVFAIQVDNAQVTSAPRTSPLILIGGANAGVAGNPAPSCTFADGTNCL